MGHHPLLQRIFLTQGSNPGLMHWQAESLSSGHQRSPNHADAEPALSTIYEVTLKADLLLVLMLRDPMALAGWVASLSVPSPRRIWLSGLCKLSDPSRCLQRAYSLPAKLGAGQRWDLSD